MAAGSNTSRRTAQSPIHRLVRTLSGKSNTPVTQPTTTTLSPLAETIPPPVAKSDEPTNTNPQTPSDPPNNPYDFISKPKILLTTVIDRFKNFNLNPGKSKKSNPRHDSPHDSRTNPNNNTTAIASTSSPTQTDQDVPSSVITGPSSSDSAVSPETNIAPTVDPQEPTYLARKIQELIDALPLPTSPSPTRTLPKPPKRDSSGRPIPPADATPIKDTKLIAILSSATIMNGGRAGEERRRMSVWSVLENLEGPSHGNQDEDEGEGERSGNEDDVGDGGDGGDIYSDGSSIMMYSPLIPSSSSLVEVADSGYVVPPSSEGESAPSGGQQPAGWMGMWPFSVLGTGLKDAAVPGQSSGVSPTSPPGSPRVGGPDGSGSEVAASPSSRNRNLRMRIQSQKVWVPSTTKLSVQAMWWGYRLYLPPPVLDVLSDKQLEATKRAAMITSALTWFFSHLPINSFPVAVRPALLLLQTLVPYVGYIGTFISWSWGTIKSYDTGHGVILTATWLLPVALIPGTWDADAFPPASPPDQAPAPLPPTNTSPSPPASTPPPSAPSSPTSPPPAPSSPSQPTPIPSPPPVSTPTPTTPTPMSQQPQPQLEPPTQSSTQPVPPSPPPPLLSPVSQIEIQSFQLPPTSPLPPWVPPPPPPSPPKIPLPEVELEEPRAPLSPRFGFGLGVGKGKGKGKGKEGDKDRERNRGKDRNEDGEKSKVKEREKGKGKLKAMASPTFWNSSRNGG